MHKVISELLGAGPVITDGAWGTQLQARGLAIGEFPDAWNITHPERVAEVAAAYVNSGSRVILTNTFGSNRLRLQEAGLADQLAGINRAGVQLSRHAGNGQLRVFASIGPSGKMLVNGEVSEEELKSAYREQAIALAEAGADALVIETMSDVAEAVIAVAAARDTGLPIVASMVFDSGKDKDRTMMGTTPEQAAHALSRAGADVIGANCGQGVAGFVSICRRLKSATDRPIWIKANAGLPRIEGGMAVYETTAQDFASFGPALAEAGASFIGGCCGTSPDFIAALKATVEKGQTK